MVTITIDEKTYEVEAGKNLLETCQSLGLEIPYFCWHPAMGSVGSCRQCAVTQFMPGDDKRERGKIVMSCMTPVTDGLIVSLGNAQAKKFRSMLIETTMTNHPHDCPVCEEAGECHLQDMTLMSGHTERRYEGPKRTHNNQYLGPFINHEMNRCIACYRCVRFYRDYSGGDDLNVFASRNNVYFGRAEDGVLENEFSGNLVEVCPTGVFTDKTLSEHYTRKWDLQSAPSICTQCSVGCNIYPGEHKNVLRRIQNRFNPLINGHFICDRGRFGYGYVNSQDKLTDTWQRDNAQQKSVKLNKATAQQALGQYLKDRSIMAIGSARSSLENNFSLLKAAGAANFYAGISAYELQQCHSVSSLYKQGKLPVTPAKSLEQCDAAVIIGEDITQTAPIIALSVRQLVRNAGKEKAGKLGVQIWQDAAVRNITQDLKSPVYIINSHSTRLHDIAQKELLATPEEQLHLLQQLTTCIQHPESTDTNSEISAIANTLLAAKKPAIITGTNSGNTALLNAATELAQAIYARNKDMAFVCALSQANSMGLAELCNHEHHLDAAMKQIETNPPETLIILETDLYRYFSAEKLEMALDKIKNIVVLDQILTPTAQIADLLIPTTSFAESLGSWVNYEGRCQLAYAVFSDKTDRQSAWQWISTAHNHAAIIEELANFKPIFHALPAMHSYNASAYHVARKTLRATGRTATYATVDIREYPPAQDQDTSYNFSPEGLTSLQLENLIVSDKASIENTPPAYLWAPRWNSNEALGHFQTEFEGPIVGSHPGVRLFDETTAATNSHMMDSAVKSAIPSGAFAALPYHNIFADDELGSYVTCMTQRAPNAAIYMHPETAKQQSLAEGALLNIKGHHSLKPLPLSLDNSMPKDVVLLPVTLLPIVGHYVFVEIAA